MMHETDLAKQVVAWLSDMGWAIYQEVKIYGRRADIVAVLKPKVMVVECKLQYGLKVFDQAMYWLPMANCVSIAVLTLRNLSCAGNHLHKCTGIGLIEVARRSPYVREIVPPRFSGKIHTRSLLSTLREEHKTSAPAGTNGGGYYTPFNETRRIVVELVRKRPGITMKEIIDTLGKCHYASKGSARVALAAWIRQGVIDGIDMRQKGRHVEYWPVREGV